MREFHADSGRSQIGAFSSGISRYALAGLSSLNRLGDDLLVDENWDSLSLPLF